MGNLMSTPVWVRGIQQQARRPLLLAENKGEGHARRFRCSKRKESQKPLRGCTSLREPLGERRPIAPQLQRFVRCMMRICDLPKKKKNENTAAVFIFVSPRGAVTAKS